MISLQHQPAVAIFILTLIMIFVRPRGTNEAWATVVGGCLMLLLRQESLAQAIQTVEKGADVLLFLLGLLVLSNLLRASGFFEWAAIKSSLASNGSGTMLYRNVFILGALTTALLSLDTTAVILTPIVLAFVSRLKLNARPFLLACAFVANSGSLLLPVSNLSNLLFVSSFHWTFAVYTATMFLPQVVVLIANYLIFRRLFVSELPRQFEQNDLPSPSEVVTDLPYFRGAIIVLILVMAGYFIGSLLHIAPFVFALAGSALLLLWGLIRRQVGLGAIRDVSWPIFPFVIGLFVVVQGIENTGLTMELRRLMESSGAITIVQTFVPAVTAAIGSNIVNNIPMALLSISSLGHGATLFERYGALLGCNLGPNITVTGSLATMLVISSARAHGEKIGASDFLKAGLKTTPILLLVGTVSLWAAQQIAEHLPLAGLHR